MSSPKTKKGMQNLVSVGTRIACHRASVRLPSRPSVCSVRAYSQAKPTQTEGQRPLTQEEVKKQVEHTMFLFRFSLGFLFTGAIGGWWK